MHKLIGQINGYVAVSGRFDEIIEKQLPNNDWLTHASQQPNWFHKSKIFFNLPMISQYDKLLANDATFSVLSSTKETAALTLSQINALDFILSI